MNLDRYRTVAELKEIVFRAYTAEVRPAPFARRPTSLTIIPNTRKTKRRHTVSRSWARPHAEAQKHSIAHATAETTNIYLPPARK